jgi:hypothetical protein
MVPSNWAAPPARTTFRRFVMRKVLLSLVLTLVGIVAVAVPVLADSTGPAWK